MVAEMNLVVILLSVVFVLKCNCLSDVITAFIKAFGSVNKLIFLN